MISGRILHGAGCVQQSGCFKYNGQLWSAQLPAGEGILPPVWNGSADLEWLQTGSPETPVTGTRGDPFLFIFKQAFS